MFLTIKAMSDQSGLLHTPSNETDNSNFEYLDASSLPPNSQAAPSRPSLSSTAFSALFDAEGRLVDEHVFRRCVFEGGIEAQCRAEAWKFLFGVFPFGSTPKERETLRLEMKLNYAAMKARWQEEAGRCRLGLEMEGIESDDVGEVFIDESFKDEITPESFDDDEEKIDESRLSSELQQQVSFMRIQATLSAHRLFELTDTASFEDALKAIHKDVPRTDRETQFYGKTQRGHKNLVRLRDALMTFAAYNADIAYVQGMNDLLARFQRVLRSESDTFWCFSHYVRRIGSDFSAVGMKSKLETLRSLLNCLDVALIRHLESRDADDLVACHRWLHLGFKREFDLEESIKIFHHLEVNSVKSRHPYSNGVESKRIYPRAASSSDSSPASLPSREDGLYTFDLFIAVAMLIQMREDLFRCNDQMDVFQVVNNRENRPRLESILSRAESLFFSYCQKSVVNCFQVDETSEKDFNPFDFIADQFRKLL